MSAGRAAAVLASLTAVALAVLVTGYAALAVWAVSADSDTLGGDDRG